MDLLEFDGILRMSGYGGARRRGNNGRGNRKAHGRGKSAPSKEPDNIPEDLVDPCKVFVSNLRPQVTESMLRDVMSHYATVEKVTIIKDKQSRNSKGYGFVKVKTEEDVTKLLNLPYADRYIHGREMVIKLAKKKISLPGDDSYVRQPLPDREFDMSQPDPTKPSIHMLVDDVIFKIFSYLPIKILVRCEGVCRRWQALVHRQFSKMTSLEINESSLDITPPFTKGIISKLLILSGPNLKSLKVQRADFATKQNILKIISQLCPVLEHLDVTKARGINFYHISRLASGCKNIKSFVAQNCFDFDDKALHQLLVSYPRLEKLNIVGTSANGKNFNLLPSTLKELCIERVPDLGQRKNRKITEIADRCPNLEVLDMRECMMIKSDLEYFGKCCPKLSKLSLYLPNGGATEALASFKNLKDLTLVGEMVDLSTLFMGLAKMEILSLDTRDIVNEADFSLLENLKSLKLNQTLLTEASLLTVAKCKQLEEFHLYKYYSLPQDILINILKGCPKLKRVACPTLQVSSSFVTTVDNIMKKRIGKLVIEVRDNGLKLQDIQYDKNKIEFDCSHDLSYLFDPFSYDSDDSDYSDVSFNTSWYDSDMELPDHYYFSDEFQDDLFDAAAMLAAWNMQDMQDYDIY